VLYTEVDALCDETYNNVALGIVLHSAVLARDNELP